MPTEQTNTSSDGKLLVLTPGLGAVATTFIAGVESIRQGLTKPIGSITQMQTIRLGMRSEGRNPLIMQASKILNLAAGMYLRIMPTKQRNEQKFWTKKTLIP